MIQEAERNVRLQNVRQAITAWYNKNVQELRETLQPVHRESTTTDLKRSVEQATRTMELYQTRFNQITYILRQLERQETHNGRESNGDVDDLTSRFGSLLRP